jgi:hypothetical protein
MENSMTQHPLPNDPQPMKDAIDTLNELGVTFKRPTLYQLKIADLSYYPGRGTIFRDASPEAMPEKGLEALVLVIKGMRQKLQPGPSIGDAPRPAITDDPAPILDRAPYGKPRFRS